MQPSLLPDPDGPNPASLAEVKAAAQVRTLEALRETLRYRGLKPAEYRLLEKLEAEHAGGEVAASTEEAARRLGVSKRTVLRWLKAGAPVRGDGTYDLEALRAWRFERDGGRPAAPDLPPTATERLKEEQAELARIKRERLEGSLVARAEVARLFARRVAVVKAGLLALPRALAPRVVGLEAEAEVAAVIEAEVIDLVRRFAGELPANLTERGDDGT